AGMDLHKRKRPRLQPGAVQRQKTMMIDWVSGVFHQRPEYQQTPIYDTGRTISVDPDGAVEWQKAGFVMVEGSHDNRIFVRSADRCSLLLSGNPVKFLQGHNLFGSTDYLGLWLSAGQEVRSKHGFFPSPETADSLFLPPRFTRLDLTRSYRFSTDASARAWLRDVASTARSRHGGSVLSGTTVYWGKTASGKDSRRWTMKAYLKSDELKARGRGHRLSSSLASIPGAVDELTDWACGVVRFELILKGMELDLIDSKLSVAGLSFADLSIADVWKWYFDRLTWNRNAEVLNMSDPPKLPNHLAGYLARWRCGEDLRACLAHDTFYRTRRALLAACGVDIASPPPAKPVTDDESPSGTSVSGLDPAGWDPEPLKAYLFEPDPALARAYAGLPGSSFVLSS
ncbi:MAG: phage/plasmid replication protein, II/X family, partial [Porticoccaceae bacterium]